MASINIDAILGKVDDWKTSDKGKKRMKSTIDKYVRTNVGKTQAGSPVLTRKAMADYGDKLIQAIQNTALSCDLPQSVAAHFSSLKRGKTTILPDGSYVMEISFTDDLTRESLEPARYNSTSPCIINNAIIHHSYVCFLREHLGYVQIVTYALYGYWYFAKYY